MKQNEIMKVKGFEFNRDVETKFGVLPMHTLVTFREAKLNPLVVVHHRIQFM